MNKVKQWEKIYPDKVNQMPVQSGIFGQCIFIFIYKAFARSGNNHGNDHGTNNNMQSMQTSHDKVKKKEKRLSFLATRCSNPFPETSRGVSLPTIQNTSPQETRMRAQEL